MKSNPKGIRAKVFAELRALEQPLRERGLARPLRCLVHSPGVTPDPLAMWTYSSRSLLTHALVWSIWSR